MVQNGYRGDGVERPTCPRCGGEVKQKGSGYIVRTEYDFVKPRRYRWECDECGAVFYSVERRPTGERECCQRTLDSYRGRQQLRFWTDLGDGVLKRELSVVCGVCGEAYLWDEKLVLRGG